MSSGPVVAVVGEVVMDLVPAERDGTYEAAPGGSPANVALTLSRLDVHARLHARLSGDLFGRRAREHLLRNGVDLSRAIAATEPTSLAVVGVGPDGGPDYDFRVHGAADWQWTDEELSSVTDGAVHVHSGSLAVTQPPGGLAVQHLLARAAATATVSYDPNCRPLLMGSARDARSVIEARVAGADVVKVSGEDLEWLYPTEWAEDVVRRWRDSGPAVVVLTLGAAGALAVRPDADVRRPGAPVQVVDTVGAGDAFMGGLLAGLLRRDLLGADRRDALRDMGSDTLGAVVDEAIRVSAITCTRRGADPPTLADLG